MRDWDKVVAHWLHESSTLGILTTDAELTVRGWNHWLENHSGHPAADLIGQNLLDAYPELAERKLTRHYQNALTGQVQVLAQGLHHHLLPMPAENGQGSEMMLQSAQIAPLIEGGRVIGTVTVIEDVTERAWTERRIEHLSTVLRAIHNVNQLIVKEKDYDRLLQGVCELLIEVHGYENAWIALVDASQKLTMAAQAGLGERFSSVAGRLARGELPQHAQKALAQAEVVVAVGDCPLSSREKNQNGMLVRLEHGKKVYGLLVVSAGERHAPGEKERGLFKKIAGDIAFALHGMGKEQALRDSEISYRTLFESTPVGISLTTPDGQVLVCNDAMLQITGYALKEFAQINLKDIYQNPQERERVRQRLQVDGRVRDLQVALKRQDGAPSYVSLSITPLTLGSEEVFLVAAEDITERKQAEETLRVYSERLEAEVKEQTLELYDAQDLLVRQEKLAILGQLAGGVAHELRNPLAVINGVVYYLRKMLAGADETQRESMDIIYAEVRNADKIVTDLLDFARVGPAARACVALSTLVNGVLDEHPPPQGVQVHADIAADLPEALVNSTQIKLVLVHLIANAHQAMPEGGHLSISAQTEQSQIVLSVADTGCGISPKNMDRLFEPLFSTKARGIGLGLVISKNLVQVNGGSISATSRKDQGSTFSVTLPTGETIL